MILFPNQNTFTALERSADDSHTLADGQVRMRLEMHFPNNATAKRIDFDVWQRHGQSAKTHKPEDAWDLQGSQTLPQYESDKDVAIE